jgi:hypothetical protein
MDYYLYSHSNVDGIFYIGKGCEGRADRWGRTKEWQEIAAKGYTTKIEANGTEKDILSLEKIVIESLIEQGVNLVNKHHNKNWDMPEEHKQKISDSNSGENNHMFGKTGEQCPNFGKKHSEEHNQKISDANSGENHPMFGKKNHGATYGNRKRWQHYRLAKANNYGGKNEI